MVDQGPRAGTAGVTSGTLTQPGREPDDEVMPDRVRNRGIGGGRRRDALGLWRGRGLALVGLAVALLAAACGGHDDLRIVNRTQVPVLVSIESWASTESRIAVGACADRTLKRLSGDVGWGDAGDVQADAAPPGAVAVWIPMHAIGKSIDSSIPTQVVAITAGYIGVSWGTGAPVPVAGNGTFPSDLGSVECAGSRRPRRPRRPRPHRAPPPPEPRRPTAAPGPRSR